MESHVALAAEKIFSIGPIPITNTIFTTWIVTFILIIFAYMATRKISAVPQGLQNIAEVAVETFQDLVSTIAGDKTKVFLPIVGSFFFFILFGNYLGLLPGIGTVGFFENDGETFVPLFRSINSDLNTTVALALVSLIATHFLSVKYLGLGGYLGKFLSLNPIFLFVGFLEIIGKPLFYLLTAGAILLFLFICGLRLFFL